MILSQKIANLLGRKISMLAIDREVYGDNTEPQNHEFSEQENHHACY